MLKRQFFSLQYFYLLFNMRAHPLSRSLQTPAVGTVQDITCFFYRKKGLESKCFYVIAKILV